MNITGKFYEFKSKELVGESEHPDSIAILINYDLLDNKDKEALISNLDFKINKNAKRENVETNNEEDLGLPCWKLIDTQGANMGNIESDEFDPEDYDAIMNRLDIYYHDYGYYFLEEIKSSGVKYEILEELNSI